MKKIPVRVKVLIAMFAMDTLGKLLDRTPPTERHWTSGPIMPEHISYDIITSYVRKQRGRL